MSARSFWLRTGSGAAAALVTVLAVPLPAPGGSLHPGPASVVGALAGAILFTLLAQRRPRALPRDLTRPQLAFLLGWAWVEEALWRRLLLGGVAIVSGVVVALAASTLLFALAHRHSLPSHLATGAVFGGVYVGTGRLVAAFAAHAAYNLLVAAERAPPRRAPA